jgi:hemerythrin-like domain-containing protein
MSRFAACDCLREDHRAMEQHLDRLMAALLHLTPGQVAEVRDGVDQIRALAAIHFAREEGIFYPRLRQIWPDLLAGMDAQHQHVRELERHVADLLAAEPEPPGERWLWELRLAAIEFHDLIQHHIVDEEDHLLRLAEDELSHSEQESLAAGMRAVATGPAGSCSGT